MDLKYPQWQEPLAEAICEFNPERLRQKLQRAEEAIVRRTEELAFDPPNGREGQALVDALDSPDCKKRPTGHSRNEG